MCLALTHCHACTVALQLLLRPKAIFAAPLMMSNDLRTMPPASRSLVLNKEMLRINQDRLGHQGRRVIVQGGPWPKPSLQVCDVCACARVDGRTCARLRAGGLGTSPATSPQTCTPTWPTTNNVAPHQRRGTTPPTTPHVHQVWARDLEHGDVAVAVYNYNSRGRTSLDTPLKFSDVGFSSVTRVRAMRGRGRVPSAGVTPLLPQRYPCVCCAVL